MPFVGGLILFLLAVGTAVNVFNRNHDAIVNFLIFVLVLVVIGAAVFLWVMIPKKIAATKALRTEEENQAAWRKLLRDPEYYLQRYRDHTDAPCRPLLDALAHASAKNYYKMERMDWEISGHTGRFDKFVQHLQQVLPASLLGDQPNALAYTPPLPILLANPYPYEDAWRLEAFWKDFITNVAQMPSYVAPLPSGDIRFEHQWVVAPSGTGKTTLLQTQIAEDLQRVQRGECSVIVIDSQNQLIPKIAHLKMFAPGQVLDGKLVLIEPDPDYPPALNVLDIGLADLSARDRYRLQAEALENVKSCMATMADTQDDMLSYIVELCFAIPGATIQTIVDILKPNGLDAYRQYLDEVDQTCRDYFETTFGPKSQGTTVTKEALNRRLMGMLRNPTFRRMFLNERGKFNMAKELAEPKVILINTDLEFLRHDACQLFGRFFIAQLLQAAEARGAASLPVYCYIDECQDYIANDDNAAKLMDKARKRRVGMIFAHQRIANITSPNVTDALSNVGIRFAGGNETDAQYLSRIFRCEPEFIANKSRGTFACYIRRESPQAFEVRVPPDTLERLPRMTKDEYAFVQAEMRSRYARPADDPSPPRPAPDAPPPEKSRAPITNPLPEVPDDLSPSTVY